MSHQITIQPAGRVYQTEGDDTLLAAAIRNGVGLPYGCKDGACGSCKSKLLEGAVIHGNHQPKALSAEEEAAGFVLTCCARPQTDCTVEARTVPGAGEFPVLKLPTRVAAMLRPAPDVAVLTMQLAANQNFQFRAGQYVEFILRDGSRRSYSMANAPHTLPGQIELHIRHMPGGKFTDHVFGALKEKDILRMEGPFGSFFLREDSDKPIVLLASGTGFAPIKAIIERARHIESKRPMVLYWGARKQADLYLNDWAALIAAESANVGPQLTYVPVLSEPDEGWTGRTGFVHRAVMEDLADLSGHQVYACGAPIMVDSAHKDFVAQCGLPDSEFYADAFTSEADKH